MTTSLWLAVGLACGQFGGRIPSPSPATVEQDASKTAEVIPAPRPALSKIIAVTVYQGQALVTREVAVPEGVGMVELVVTPLPPETVAGSLYTEGAEGLLVLSTRFRSRAVKEDTRQEVRVKEDSLKQLGRDAQRLQKEAEVQQEDLSYLRRLEVFTGGFSQ